MVFEATTIATLAESIRCCLDDNSVLIGLCRFGRVKKTLENHILLADNGLVITGKDWVDGRQAARIHGQ